MYIVTVWCKGVANKDWAINATTRGNDKQALARQAEFNAANWRRQNYLTQVLIAEVTHEVVPPEALIKIVPYKEPEDYSGQ